LVYKEIIADFFRGHERTVRAKINVLGSLFMRGISIIISLVLVPLTINYINPTQYGIWLTLTSIISWFGFFDMGFGNGLRNKLTETIVKKEYERSRGYISTAYAVFFAVFFSIWLIFVILNHFLDWARILNAPPELGKELSWLAFIVLSYFCLQIILRTINVVLTADQKPAIAAMIEMLGQAIALVVIYILTKTTRGSLINLGLGIGLAPVLVLIVASIWYYSRTYKKINPEFGKISKAYAKEMGELGIKFFFLQVASMIIFQANNIVIAHVCGPEDVTVFNVAYKYFSLISMVFIIIITPFWSAFTDAYNQKDISWMKNTIRKLEKIWIGLAIGGVCLLILSKFFFEMWVGDKVLVPFSVSALLLLYVLVYSRFNLYLYLLNGIGKIKLQVLVYVPLALLNIPILILFGLRLGLIGLILGNILISLPHLIYGPIQLRRIIENRANGLWNQ
jgi:O-antigen/teichoic acid export membrane protein